MFKKLKDNVKLQVKKYKSISLTNKLLILLILVTFLGFFGRGAYKFYRESQSDILKTLRNWVTSEEIVTIKNNIYFCNEIKQDFDQDKYNVCIDIENQNCKSSYYCGGALTELKCKSEATTEVEVDVVHSEPANTKVTKFLGFKIKEEDVADPTKSPRLKGCELVSTE